ncbi:MAG TPA: lytic transglycosylase domain-containing protein, partial [Thermoleophilaceae bacterium]|nr:lytic transglycosylase domain-containing protein [Thermoleophilaceae bacterium]
MKTRLLTILLAAGSLVAAVFTGFSIPAAAQTQTVPVRLPSGEVVQVTVDVPPGSTIDDIQLPGTPVAPQAPAPTTPTAPKPAPAPKPEPTAPAPAPRPGPPNAGGGTPQDQTNSGERIKEENEKVRKITGGVEAPVEDEGTKKKERKHRRDRDSERDRDGRTELRNSDGTPTPGNPGFIDALPGPSTATGVPNFIIRKFRVPPFLLPIYQAAGIEYGIRWEILAAINEIETDYGRNLNVSSAGAVGWMQFMPSTWAAYGTDANKDGRKDPYNPVDAIFA